MAITFVTAFFDIGRQTDAPQQNFNNYFQWIMELLALPINLYFFTTPELHAQLIYDPRPNLIWKFMPEVPYMDRLDQIRATWPEYQTNNPSKDTPEFAALSQAKFVFLQQAITTNPFGDSHYAWIDAGLTKIATHPELLPGLAPPDKIRCIMMNYIGVEEIKDPRFIQKCHYKIAAGLFIGPKDLMLSLAYRVMGEVEQHLHEHRFGLEQECIAIVYRQHPEMFDPYYGSFEDLILNYERLVNNAYIAQKVMRQALAGQDLPEALKVTRYIKASRT